METDRFSRRRYDVNPFLDELAPAYQENEYKLRYCVEKVGILALNTTRAGMTNNLRLVRQLVTS